MDVALIEAAMPGSKECSLGVSVDIIKAAVDAADYVLALINPHMPWTEGDSLVKIQDIDAFVADWKGEENFTQAQAVPLRWVSGEIREDLWR